jgi:hypothetical protein
MENIILKYSEGESGCGSSRPKVVRNSLSKSLNEEMEILVKATHD